MPPADKFLTSGGLHPHFHPAIRSLREGLGRMQFPLHEVHRQFRIEKQPHAQDFLPAGDAEGFSRVGFGVEVRCTPERRARTLDYPEP